jgi:radical SAM superfamily enzyme YgiQ (UPF0313 family)
VEPGGILLVSCYELGRQPLGLALPAAFLREAGFEPATVDLAADPLDEHVVKRARLVAISVPMHTALRTGAAAARKIRALNPGAHVCFFGLYAALNADWLFSSGLADSAIGGEYEAALVALARAIHAGDDAPVAGVSVAGRPAAPILRRLAFPAPSRKGLPTLDRYAKIEIGGRQGLAAAVEASRGCLHLCRHCPIPPVYEGRFFAIEPEVVLADVDAVAAAGAVHVTFADPDFLNGPAHARRIAEELHRRHPAMTWDFTAKIEHLIRHRDLLPGFARAGAVFAVSAVESLAPKVLEVLDKGHTRADVERALELTRDAGLFLRPSLMPFTPWATLDDYLELLDFVIERDLADQVDPVQLTIRLLVPPGSLLERHPEMTPHLGALDREALTWSWTHPDPRMDALQREVTAVVAESARAAEDPVVTFDRLRDLALGVAGRVADRARRADAAARRPRAPRLTEPWFC